MILDPINDVDCLGQLTHIARELAPSTLIQTVAKRLRTRQAIIEWFRSLPQIDDNGDEAVRFIQCDVPQRVRLLPDDPNCVERTMGAMMLFEAIDPRTPRAMATIDRPLRHTGLVEQRRGHWIAVDLFPRRNAPRNFNWGEFGKDVLQGVHNYVGKPVLSFYGLGGVADQLGEGENKLIGRDKKKPPEKKEQPPAGGKQPEQRPNAQPSQGSAQPRKLSMAVIGGALGSGEGKDSSTKGGADGKEKEKERVPAGAAAAPGAVDGARGAQEGKEAKRWWWSLG